LHGDNFGAGEIGHLVLIEDGLLCRCGNTGCLETVASASAIERGVRAAAAADPRSALHQTAARGLPLDMEAVLRAYESGDVAVGRVVLAAGRGLGLAIATLVGTLNVRDVILTGPVSGLGQPLL